jgi:4-hydroxy-tetrahydrodipicolinate synthase
LSNKTTEQEVKNMTNRELRGVIPPILTLFDRHGEPDEELQRRYVDYLIDHGVHGLFVCGTFGSGIMLTVEQHQKVTQICIDQAKKCVPCIVHVGSTSTDISVTLAKNAEAAGAAVVSAVPPFYYKYSNAAMVAHYAALVKSVKIPVYAYNNAETSGYLITPEVAVQMARVGVSGMKDTGPIENFYLMKTRMAEAGLDFDFVIGTCGHWLPAALMGVKAMVTGSSNIFPEVVVDMYNTTMTKGVQAAADLQMKVIRLRDIQLIGGKNTCTMAVLEMRGIPAGFPKAPFQPLDAAVKQRIRDAVVKEGLAGILKG